MSLKRPAGPDDYVIKPLLAPSKVDSTPSSQNKRTRDSEEPDDPKKKRKTNDRWSFYEYKKDFPDKPTSTVPASVKPTPLVPPQKTLPASRSMHKGEYRAQTTTTTTTTTTNTTATKKTTALSLVLSYDSDDCRHRKKKVITAPSSDLEDLASESAESEEGLWSDVVQSQAFSLAMEEKEKKECKSESEESFSPSKAKQAFSLSADGKVPFTMVQKRNVSLICCRTVSVLRVRKMER